MTVGRRLLAPLLAAAVVGLATTGPAAASPVGRVHLDHSAPCPASSGVSFATSPHPVARRTVALTFDDGPSPATTPLILDVLRRNHVHATFFVVGGKAAAHPDLLRRIAAEGHLVGNHSYTHPLPRDGGAFDRLPPSRVAAEIDRTTAVISTVTGKRPCFFRAPGGHDRAAVLRHAASARGLAVVYWTYDPRDWDAPAWRSPAYQRLIVRNATGTARHPVVLMHDGPDDAYRGNTAESLQRVIDFYRGRGYVFTDPAGRRFPVS